MDKQSGNKNHRQRFLQAQSQLGLTSELFEAKFVYSQQQVLSESHSQFFLHKFQPIPSQLSGFSLHNIRTIQAWASNILFQAGKSLKVPITTTALAQMITHFFYCRHSYIDYDIRDVVMGAMFLACKSEETLRKSFQVALVFDYIFKVTQEEKKLMKVFDVESVEKIYMKNRVVKSELDILFDLGFEIYRLSDLPHRYIGGILSLFDNHPQKQKIAINSWVILNDIFRTTACLSYPPQILAAAAVYIGMKKNSVSFPSIPWWCLMDASMESIEKIEVELELVYELGYKDLNNENIAKIINGVGQQYYGLINVFPIPYYRKIMLDNRNKIRIKKNAPKPQPELPKQQYQVAQREVEEHEVKDDEEEKRQKKKKIRKSSKKKKKDKKYRKEKKQRKKKKEKYNSSELSQSHSNSQQINEFAKLESSEVKIDDVGTEKIDAGEKKEENKKFKGFDLKKGLSGFAEQFKKREEIKKEKEEKQKKEKEDLEKQKNEEIKMESEDEDEAELLAQLRKKILLKKEQQKNKLD